MCVDEAMIVRIDPGGIDNGTCTLVAPCRTINYAVTKATATRNHIVVELGGYIEPGTEISASSTSAPALYIHGGGATLSTSTPEGPTLWLSIATTLKHLKIERLTGSAALLQLNAGGSYVVEDVEFRGGGSGITLDAPLTARDIRIVGAKHGIELGASAQLTLDRAVISGGQFGLVGLTFGASVKISNMLVYGAETLGMDLTKVSGTVEFSTIADSGSDAGTGPRAVSCSQNVTIRSSIVWAPGTTTRVPLAGCNVASTIAGPTAIPGASSSNPQFIDSANHDYHLSGGSPARDAVETGPAWDFEGDPRPSGARFDIGADE